MAGFAKDMWARSQAISGGSESAAGREQTQDVNDADMVRHLLQRVFDTDDEHRRALIINDVLRPCLLPCGECSSSGKIIMADCPQTGGDLRVRVVCSSYSCVPGTQEWQCGFGSSVCLYPAPSFISQWEGAVKAAMLVVVDWNRRVHFHKAYKSMYVRGEPAMNTENPRFDDMKNGVFTPENADDIESHIPGSTVDIVRALRELVHLKELKDKCGKTDEYLRRQPLAWEFARRALGELEDAK